MRMPPARYHIPTTVVTDRGGMARAGSLLPTGCPRVLVVTGRVSARRTGHLDRLVASLKKTGAAVQVFDGVEENPSLDTVDRGAHAAHACDAAAVVGLGGGSALDAAKAIAVCAATGMTVGEVLAMRPAPRGSLWFLAIPTTAGTGSETTPYALLTDPGPPDKLNLVTPDSFPACALLDAELTATLPPDLTRNTGVDALSHAVEGYLSLRAQPLSDAHAEHAVTLIGRALPRVLDAPHDLDAREDMLVASCLAGMVIAHTGTTACHALSYYLTLIHGVHHGCACGMLLGATVEWARTFVPRKVDRIEHLLGMGIGTFITRCGLPSLASCRLDDNAVAAMAASAAPRSSVQSTAGTPGSADLKMIVQASLPQISGT